MTSITKAKAQELHGKIRKAADGLMGTVEAFETEWELLRKLLAEAKANNLWEVLGYPSWAAYCVNSIGLSANNVEERRWLVALLVNEAGLSTRAIAAMLNVSHDTVWRDIGKVSDLLTDHAVDHVSGLDGAERPRRQPENPTNKRDRSKPEPTPQLRYIKVYNTASEDVSKLIHSVESDEQIACEAAKELDHLIEMRDGLSTLIKKLRKVKVPELESAPPQADPLKELDEGQKSRVQAALAAAHAKGAENG